MIESNENTAIVDFTYRDHGNMCEGTALIRCERGEEKMYLERVKRVRRVEIKNIIRHIKAL